VPGLGQGRDGSFTKELHGSGAANFHRVAKGLFETRIPERGCAYESLSLSASQAAAASPGVRTAERTYKVASGWMNETAAGT
jgi:hypothetical protein